MQDMTPNQKSTGVHERLRARTARVAKLRKTVVALAIALFLAVWTIIFVQIASGRDPGTTSTTPSGSSASTGSTGSGSSASTGSTGSGSSASTGSTGSGSSNAITTGQS